MKKLLLILLCLPFIGFGQGWEQNYGGMESQKGYSGQQTSDGGYIICGWTNNGFINGNVDRNIFVVKTDSNGNQQWSQNFNGETTDGGYIMCGYTYINFDRYLYLIKTDGNGVELWSQIYAETNNDASGYSVQQTTDGGYIITGETGWRDVWLIKTDSQGDTAWTKKFGEDQSAGRTVQQTTDGGYIIFGETYIDNNTGFFSYDMYLIKTDGNGNITSEFTIPMSSNRKLEKVVDILGRETKGTKNEPLFYIYDDGTVEKKVIIE